MSTASIGDRLSRHSIQGVAEGGREQLIDTIIGYYQVRANQSRQPDEAMNNLENDLCLLVGYRCDLMANADITALQLWDEVLGMTVKETTLTPKLMRASLQRVHEKELLALLGIAVQRDTQSILAQTSVVRKAKRLKHASMRTQHGQEIIKRVQKEAFCQHRENMAATLQHIRLRTRPGTDHD